MLVDAFMFYNELDILEYRLTLLDPYVDLVPVQLEAPLGERLGAGVVAAAGARGQDEDADLGHAGFNAGRNNPPGCGGSGREARAG